MKKKVFLSNQMLIGIQLVTFGWELGRTMECIHGPERRCIQFVTASNDIK